jgi:hypothetical protein
MAYRGAIAGRRLIERRHCPRIKLEGALLLARENGLPVLPEAALWALNLQEGDLLTVEEGEGPRIFLESYLCQLEVVLDTWYEPWRFLELVFEKPMAAVGPNGTLLLPEAAETLLRSQEGVLVLRQLLLPKGRFELRREAEPPRSPAVSPSRRPG